MESKHSAAAAFSPALARKEPLLPGSSPPPPRASSLAQPALSTQTTNRCPPLPYPLLLGLASIQRQSREGEPMSRLGLKPGSRAPTRRAVLGWLPGVRAAQTPAQRPGVARIIAATLAERTGPAALERQGRWSARAGAAPRRARRCAPKFRGAHKTCRGE